jgi:hypothetical protein
LFFWRSAATKFTGSNEAAPATRWITIVRTHHPKRPPMNRSGIVLIVLGLLFLAHNFGWLQFDWLRQWWPLLLIALGVWSILNHKPGDKSAPGSDNGTPRS